MDTYTDSHNSEITQVSLSPVGMVIYLLSFSLTVPLSAQGYKYL